MLGSESTIVRNQTPEYKLSSSPHVQDMIAQSEANNLVAKSVFRYDFGTSQVLKLTHYPDGVSFDYYHYSEDDPSLYSIVVSVYRESHADNSPDDGFDLLDIGNGEEENSIDNAHALIYNSELHSFDISPDGKKILFQKTIESDYG